MMFILSQLMPLGIGDFVHILIRDKSEAMIEAKKQKKKTRNKKVYDHNITLHLHVTSYYFGYVAYLVKAESRNRE